MQRKDGDEEGNMNRKCVIVNPCTMQSEGWREDREPGGVSMLKDMEGGCGE